MCHPVTTNHHMFNSLLSPLTPAQHIPMPDSVHIDHVSCGSAHTICWSSIRRKLVCKLPEKVPMEFNHIQSIPMTVLRNRLILLHHFSNLFCKSLSLFSLQSKHSDLIAAGGVGVTGEGAFSDGFDHLRGLLISSAKVCTHVYMYMYIVNTVNVRVYIHVCLCSIIWPTAILISTDIFFSRKSLRHVYTVYTVCICYLIWYFVHACHEFSSSWLLGNCVPSCDKGDNDTGQAARPGHRAEQNADEEVKRSGETGRTRWTQLRIWSDVLKMVHSRSGGPPSATQSVEGEDGGRGRGGRKRGRV